MSTTTADHTWHAIKGWEKLGLKHDDAVAAFVEAYRKISEYIHESDTELPSLADPDTIVEAIEAHAEHIALREGTNAPLSRAISKARTAVAHKGIRAARENVNHYRDQLTARFDAASEVYVRESAKLPEKFTGDDLAGFNADQFAAYQAVKQAADEIRSVRNWLSSLAQILPGSAMTEFKVQFLVLDPGSVEVFKTVQYAASASADRIYEAVDPVMLKAVKAGAELRMATPAERNAECRAYAAELEAELRKADTRLHSAMIR